MKRLPMTVIIPTHGRTLDLRELLGSLERQNRRLEYEVLVVANLPEPGLKKVVESHGPRFRFLETGRIGVNIARNKGLERARGEILVFFDDDAYVPDKDFLERVWLLHQTHPQALAIGGPYSLRAGASICETAYHLILKHRVLTSLRRYDESTLLLGGNWSCKAHGADGKIRFDDSVVFGGADVELFARLRVKGASFVFDRSIPLVHRPRLGLLSYARRAYSQGLVFGRVNPSVDRLRHWNSTISVRECADAEKIRWSKRVAFYVSFYEKIFAFGARAGESKGTSAPAFSMGRIVASFLPDFSTAARDRLLIEAATVVENALDVARQESAADSH